MFGTLGAFPLSCRESAPPAGSRCFREHLENYSAHFIGIRTADGRAGRKDTGKARTADRGGRAEIGDKETAGTEEHKKSR